MSETFELAVDWLCKRYWSYVDELKDLERRISEQTDFQSLQELQLQRRYVQGIVLAYAHWFQALHINPTHFLN